MAELVAEVGAADLVVVASPTYKATYTGLLKLFLDRFSTDGLRGVAVPLMLGAGPAHALAPELSLRPVLAEIGGTTGPRPLRPRQPPRRPVGVRRLAGAGATGRRRAGRGPRVSLGSLTTNQDLDAARLRAAFGVFPSGVVAVAAEVDGQLTGLAASSFTSVSLEPPLVSFSVANTSKTWPDLRRAAHLGLTVLADHHGEVCRRLAGPVEHRFDDVPVTGVRRRGGHPGRGTGPLRLQRLPRGRGRRPHDRDPAAPRG